MLDPFEGAEAAAEVGVEARRVTDDGGDDDVGGAGRRRGEGDLVVGGEGLSDGVQGRRGRGD